MCTLIASRSSHASPTVLLLEDDVLVRMPLADYLRSCGFRVLEAGRAPEAMALMNAGLAIDLLFTKVKLTGPNGFAIANWVRRNFPGVKVLLAGSIANATEKAGHLCAKGPLGLVAPHETVLRRIQALLHQAKRPGARPASRTSVG